MRMLKPRFIALPAAAATLTVLCIFPAAVGEGDEAGYTLQYYTDDNLVRVLTNTVEATKTIGRSSLAVSYLVDAITGASRRDIKGASLAENGIENGDDGRGEDENPVDAITSATPVDGITSASVTKERRHQVSGTFSFVRDFITPLRQDKNNDDPTSLSVTGLNSDENDYHSRTVSLALSQDLFQRNSTVGLRFGRSFDRYSPPARFIPSSADAGWGFLGNGRRLTDNFSASFTQGITTTTVGSIIFGYAYDRGYLARPYYVYEIDNVYYHENLPPRRRGMTVSAQLNQYAPVAGGASVHLRYRYYTDSWELASHTASVALFLRLGDHCIINPSYRFYLQSDAFFYKDVYTAPPVYLTTDFKFRHGMTHTPGLKLSYELNDFVKPDKGPFFGLYPVAFDIGADYFVRSGTRDISVRDSHYNYWNPESGFQALWLQAGVRVAY
jgi:hypothetical protein